MAGWQAFPGDYRNDHNPSYLRYAQSPRTLPDLLLLVHRHWSSTPSDPYRSIHLLGKHEIVVAQTIQEQGQLGLLPLVKKLQIHEICIINYTFALPKRPGQYPCFAATDVQELEMDYPDIPWLMPRAQRGFGHLPTLRSLSLREPKGSCRQNLYFIGLFQNLEDLKLLFEPDLQEGSVDDLTLVPRFTPPL